MIDVYCSSVIAAPVRRVWALVRDFNGMPEWNAAVRSSRIENGPADRIGCRRLLTFDDGRIWVHELTGLSDPEMTVAYAIIGAPAGATNPPRDYTATIRLEPVTDGDRCFIAWRARFEADDAATMERRAEAVFQAGFDGLKHRFAG